jgi:hypothetical protein
MKTLLTLAAIVTLSHHAQSQTVHDLTRMRARLLVREIIPQGVVCEAHRLVKGKLGREEPGEALIPMLPSGPAQITTKPDGSVKKSTSFRPSFILVKDLDFTPVKAGEHRDLDLCVTTDKLEDLTVCFVSSGNALLHAQGKFQRVINLARLEACAFEARITQYNTSRLTMTRLQGGASFRSGGDPLATDEPVKLFGIIPEGIAKLYHTADLHTFTFSAAAALKTFTKN